MRRLVGSIRRAGRKKLFFRGYQGEEALQAHLDAIAESPPTFTVIDEVTARYDSVPLGSPSAAIARHDRAAFRDATYRQVETLTELMEAYQPSPVERMQDRLLEVTAEDEPLLRQLLRFVAVLPSLRFDRSRHEVTRALRENARLLRQVQQQRRGL